MATGLPTVAGLQLRYEAEIPAVTLCNPNLPNATRAVVRFSLATGDGVSGVRVCYGQAGNAFRVVGITFTSIAGQHTCGNVAQPPEACVSSSTSLPGPLSVLQGTCAGPRGALSAIQAACWNKYYTPLTLQQRALLLRFQGACMHGSQGKHACARSRRCCGM